MSEAGKAAPKVRLLVAKPDDLHGDRRELSPTSFPLTSTHVRTWHAHTSECEHTHTHTLHTQKMNKNIFLKD